MFQFPASPPYTLCIHVYVPELLSQVGFPIRTSVGQRLFAPNHSFSQLVASFIGFRCQGIHPVLLVTWPFIFELSWFFVCFVFSSPISWLFSFLSWYVVVFLWYCSAIAWCNYPFYISFSDIHYSVFNVQWWFQNHHGGLEWNRTIDLTLIRRAL